jgi:mannose-6-phosphate isomerase-like protein (cupin superfamily)
VQKRLKERIIVRNVRATGLEDAHEGAVKRRIIFSKSDSPKSRLEAVSVGYLPKLGRFDWHKHDGIDEIMEITSGKAKVESEEDVYQVGSGNFVLIPSGTLHRITNTGQGKLKALFVRFHR